MRTKVKPDEGSTESQLNERVVEEIRVWMIRRNFNQVTLAEALGVSQVWVSRRLGTSRDVMLTLAEVERFAAALDVPQESLLRVTHQMTGDSAQALILAAA